MSVKIRLQRHGKKASAFYHIVIADGRAPRDGKFIEKIGTYNPTTNPATILLDNDKALAWLKNGAQPTDTCRAILSYKGVMFRNHLEGGIAKGALTQEQADAKYAKWQSEKEGKIETKVSKLSNTQKDAYKNRMAAEAAAKEAKAAKIVVKNTPPVVEEPVVEESAPATPEAETQAEA
ncbi:MAG: 30S ribosomal protein S16 [Bacteroidetes bacterium RIFCSPLOWO2_12_FULL_35_15]|nr:MAG: 30S ribosomal protein S16 [Bacteroidetes bacterium RIFCSPLOWO2_12_FULL_35_15]